MAQLSGQERVRRMFAREAHDRVPRYDSFWAETIRRWQGEGLQGGYREAYDALGSDMHQLTWWEPEPFPGVADIVREDERTRDVRNSWGALLRQWKERTGTPQHLGFECCSRRAWEERFRPAMVGAGVTIDLDAAAARHADGRSRGQWCFIGCIEAYEVMKRMMGDEIALAAMAEDPEWIVDVSRVATDAVVANLQAVLDRGIQPDGVFLSGDMGYNHGLLFSPGMYRRLLWPDHRRLSEWIHAHGMSVLFHSDGNVNEAVDLYIAAGFDVLHPLEVNAGMDLRALAPRYGSRLGFMGNIDKVALSTNDRERVEVEVRARLAAGMATGAYGYHSDHSVPPQVSWDTYRFVIDLLERYGRY